MKIALAFLVAMALLASNAYAITWIGGSASPASGSQYSPSANYSLQIGVDGNGKNISTVLFESNFSLSFSNSSAYNASGVYFVNFTDLQTGSYKYRWHAMDNDSIWSSTDWLYYILVKNSSAQINLYFNDSEGNRSYTLYSIANLTAAISLPNKLVYMNSTYPSFVQQSGYTTVSYLLNISSPGTYNVTAYWNGDANYTAFNKTFFIGDFPPQYSEIIDSPSGGNTYGTGPYSFSIRWASANISQAWFESNHTGIFVNYTINSTPAVQKGGNYFFINFSTMAASNFLYRWFANDSLNRVSSTGQIQYRIWKANPLQLQPAASSVVTSGTKTTVRCIILTSEMTVDSFKLYRDSTLITNDTLYSRKDETTLDVGTYFYVCNTTGTQNFTNQTLNYTLNVTSNQTLPKTFTLDGPSSVRIAPGASSTLSFSATNNLGYSLSNLTVFVNNLDSGWYSIGGIASSIPDNFSIQFSINLAVPNGTAPANYSFVVRVTGRSSNETKEAPKTVILSVYTPSSQTLPPVYSPETVNTSVNGDIYEFALKWTDDTGLAGYIFSSNITGNWTNDTFTPLSGTDGWSYAYKNATLSPGTVVGWKFFVEDASNQWSQSDLYYLGASKPGIDMVSLFIVAVFIIALAGALFFIAERKRKRPAAPAKEEVFVYNQKDLK